MSTVSLQIFLVIGAFQVMVQRVQTAAIQNHPDDISEEETLNFDNDLSNNINHNIGYHSHHYHHHHHHHDSQKDNSATPNTLVLTHVVSIYLF